MITLSRPKLGALTLATLLSVACGGPSAKKAAGPDGGEAGAEAGVGGDKNTGGSNASSGGAGGGGGTSNADKTPPTFAGAKDVDVTVGEDRVVVSWDAATDPPNPADRIAYRVYRSAKSGAEDFSRALRCGASVADAGSADPAMEPCYVTTGAGATSAVVRDVLPAQQFYYVVRAVDAAGNEDTNTKEVTGTTADETAPEFGGVRGVAVVSATSIRVSWGAGFDLGTPDSLLKFNVYLGEGVNPDPTKDTPVYVSTPGERSHLIGCNNSVPCTKTGVTQALKPSTSYKVMVRAVDAADHADSNERVVSVTTPEGVAPTFDGVRRASAEGTSIRLFWSQASDNVTSAPSIVYDVYQSLRKAGEDLTAPPTATSTPGASSILMSGLEPGTRYYYVVKARDIAGKRDEKLPPLREVEVNATTATPDTAAPTFGGADSVTGSSPTSVDIKWTSANDDRSLNARDFTYLIYASTASPVPLTTPSLTVSGVTSATLVGLTPGTTYNVVVIAQDAAGNKSTASASASGATLAAIAGDTEAPKLGTGPTVTQDPTAPTHLALSWAAATDNTYNPATDVRYHVCASTVEADCQGSKFAQHVLTTTAFGTTSASLLFLTTHTSYFIYVRSEDRAGNLEAIGTSKVGTTPTSWANDVKSILFDRCIACHNFDTPSAIVNVVSSYTDETNEACKPAIPDDKIGCQLKFIDPRRPEFSYIYRKVNPAGIKTLPFSSLVPNAFKGLHEPRDITTPLTVVEDEILYSWIFQGALGN